MNDEPDANLAPVWRPLSELPAEREMHIVVVTPGGVENSYRWLRYRKGAQWPYIGGRWQIATEYSWKNADLPKQGEWRPNPVRRQAVAKNGG